MSPPQQRRLEILHYPLKTAAAHRCRHRHASVGVAASSFLCQSAEVSHTRVHTIQKKITRKVELFPCVCHQLGRWSSPSRDNFLPHADLMKTFLPRVHKSKRPHDPTSTNSRVYERRLLLRNGKLLPLEGLALQAPHGAAGCLFSHPFRREYGIAVAGQETTPTRKGPLPRIRRLIDLHA